MSRFAIGLFDAGGVLDGAAGNIVGRWAGLLIQAMAGFSDLHIVNRRDA
jgi:hypothetical protein